MLQDNWDVVDFDAESQASVEEQPLPHGWEERVVSCLFEIELGVCQSKSVC